MEMKWKIYYLCSLYLLLWAASVICIIVYGLFDPHKVANNIVISIAFAVLLIIIANSVISIRFLSLHKKGSCYSKPAHLAFYISYGFIIVFTTASLILLATALPQAIKKREFNGGMDIALNAALVLATICLLYISILAPSLAKAIRTNYLNSIETIGQPIQP